MAESSNADSVTDCFSQAILEFMKTDSNELDELLASLPSFESLEEQNLPSPVQQEPLTGNACTLLLTSPTPTTVKECWARELQHLKDKMKNVNMEKSTTNWGQAFEKW